MDILCPLFVQVALTFILLLATGISRFRSVNSGAVKAKDIALRQPNWTQQPTKFANSFHNQLETPILFYLLVTLLLVTDKVTDTLIYLAWGYVAARIIHALIHVTYNHVLHRFLIFIISIAILAAMWVMFYQNVSI
ncbi:MAG: membrane protein [Rhodomicrobium sp.]|nr:MAG: membrane protein [Rhodomicrobium sp.]